MVMSMQTTLLATALFAVGVACQDTAQQPVFTYPPDGSNYTYHRMDTVIVNYTVPYDTAELSTFCNPAHEKPGASPPTPHQPSQASAAILTTRQSTNKPCPAPPAASRSSSTSYPPGPAGSTCERG